MSYFNHAFHKSFVATSADVAGGIKTKNLAAGQLALVNGATWTSVAALPVPALGYLVQGSFHTKDNVGNNPGHGGYKESVKSKGINPKFITKIWESDCVTATAATASVELGPKCAPCGSGQMLRLDVKGAPALRFLNHNAYAIADSGNICCADNQEFLDPALVIAEIAKGLLADPLVSPFVAEPVSGGVVVTSSVTGSVVTTTYTIEEILDGTYVASLQPEIDLVSAKLTLIGAYVDTKFGNCSFDTRDYFGKEPVQLILSFINESGEPCDSCGVATKTPGTMQQTTGEGVLRNVLMTEAYMQSPFNQGNVDSSRIREIEGSNDIIAAVDRNALYKAYYVQHSIPRLSNPTGVFDNDQYVYEIFVKCTDTATQAKVDTILAALVTAAGASGNPIVIESIG